MTQKGLKEPAKQQGQLFDDADLWDSELADKGRITEQDLLEWEKKTQFSFIQEAKYEDLGSTTKEKQASQHLARTPSESHGDVVVSYAETNQKDPKKRLPAVSQAPPLSVTPMMKQYQGIKAQYPHCLLFYRLGDFYELFYDDALKASELLHITLTQRHGVPMCGVPHHASENYIKKLLQAGEKVALCEQEAQQDTKTLVQRRVIRVFTPGSLVEDSYLGESVGNYIMAITPSSLSFSEGEIVSAFIDITTGEFFGHTYPAKDWQIPFKKDFYGLRPKEFLISEKFYQETDFFRQYCRDFPDVSVEIVANWFVEPTRLHKILLDHFQVLHLKSFGLSLQDPHILAAGMLIEYLQNTMQRGLAHIQTFHKRSYEQHTKLDAVALKNLELLHSPLGKVYTLFHQIDRTQTPLGRRLLKQWMLYPLKEVAAIVHRQEQVSFLLEAPEHLTTMQEYFKRIQDIPKFLARLALNQTGQQDLLQLKTSLQATLTLMDSLEEFVPRLDRDYLLSKEERIAVQRVFERLTQAVAEPLSDDQNTFLKPQYHKKLLHFYQLHTQAKLHFKELLEAERAQHQLPRLRVSYNKILGYFLEIPKTQAKNIPSHYIKKQSLVNVERYTNEALIGLEVALKEAKGKFLLLEEQLVQELCTFLRDHLALLQGVSQKIAHIDVFKSFAQQALSKAYIRPELDDSKTLNIEKARHPIVEAFLSVGEFVANDVHLNDAFFGLITGPNMAGKSTYLRQVALLCVMAQMGSFIPAHTARVGIVDQIFCRVGAQDNLAQGESTFLVEMSETAFILKNATPKSLIIMDEVGRGTSTQDGLALAFAICEHILLILQCRTLFATHYHELCEFQHPSLQNYSFKILEREQKILFLRQLENRPSLNSYGIFVAKLAGIPASVLQRASLVFSSFQQHTEQGLHFVEQLTKDNDSSHSISDPIEFVQPSTEKKEGLVHSPLEERLLALPIQNMTPLEAFQWLVEQQELLQKSDVFLHNPSRTSL